jgi:hypothetical protein
MTEEELLEETLKRIKIIEEDMAEKQHCLTYFQRYFGYRVWSDLAILTKLSLDVIKKLLKLEKERIALTKKANKDFLNYFYGLSFCLSNGLYVSYRNFKELKKPEEETIISIFFPHPPDFELLVIDIVKKRIEGLNELLEFFEEDSEEVSEERDISTLTLVALKTMVMLLSLETERVEKEQQADDFMLDRLLAIDTMLLYIHKSNHKESDDEHHDEILKEYENKREEIVEKINDID